MTKKQYCPICKDPISKPTDPAVCERCWEMFFNPEAARAKEDRSAVSIAFELWPG